MTPEEFLDKVEWEGGIAQAVEYGLTSAHLDDPDSDFGRAWDRVVFAVEEFEQIAQEFYDDEA